MADAVVVEPVSAYFSLDIREKNSEESRICSEKPPDDRYLEMLSGVYPVKRQTSDQGKIAVSTAIKAVIFGAVWKCFSAFFQASFAAD